MPEAAEAIYVIVCKGRHSAEGPYDGLRAALDAANRKNANESCPYLPVELKFLGEVVTVGEDESPHEWRGQYL